MKNKSKLEFNVETLVTFFANTEQNQGVYVCKNCGQKIFIEDKTKLPYCPKCGGKIFTKE